MIAFTIFEYVVSVVLESLFGLRWWDYTGQPFNFQGRVSLSFSIVWGILGVIFVEKIHPFQDGNGRVGRLIMFKECLRNGITPFIIEDDIKEFYYRGLKEWKNEQGYLMDTCLTAQDRFKVYMDYFGLEYKD